MAPLRWSTWKVESTGSFGFIRNEPVGTLMLIGLWLCPGPVGQSLQETPETNSWGQLHQARLPHCLLLPDGWRCRNQFWPCVRRKQLPNLVIFKVKVQFDLWSHISCSLLSLVLPSTVYLPGCRNAASLIVLCVWGSRCKCQLHHSEWRPDFYTDL